MVKKRRVAVGPLAVGTPLDIHLQQAQINAELELLLPIGALELSHHDLARLVLPVVE